MTSRFRLLLATVVLLLFTLLTGACGSDGSGDITVADLEGTWVATSLTVTANDDPGQSIDLIAVGGSMEMAADESGRVEGTLTVPAALGGGDLPVMGQLDVVDQETMAVSFDPEIPPLLVGYSGPFTLEGSTLTVTDEEGSFDFGTGTPVSASSTVVFERSS